MKGTFPLLTKFITNICKQGGKRSYLPISDDDDDDDDDDNDDDDDDNVYLALAGGHPKNRSSEQICAGQTPTRLDMLALQSIKVGFEFCVRFCVDSAHYADYIIIFMFCLLPKVQTVVIYICAGLPRSTDIAVEKQFLTGKSKN